MDAPTPPKRQKLSYCDIDFLVKLQTTVKKSQPVNGTDGRDLNDLSLLGKHFLALLRYGADVNVNLNWRQPPQSVPRSGSRSTLNLTASAGDVNCDSDDLSKPPLHQNDHVQVRMNNDALVKLLTNEGLDVNCPKLAGDLSPLILEEARRRITILQTLVTFGTDTNLVRRRGNFGDGCDDDANCEFCWNLQFLKNFGQFQQQQQQLDTQGPGPPVGCRGLVLNALLATGSDVNSMRCSGDLGSLGQSQGQGRVSISHTHTLALTDLLVTHGHKVNSIICD